MNVLISELRQFGIVNFNDDSHADWILDQYQFKFKISIEDISQNLIGAKLIEFRFQNTIIQMSGQYFIKPGTTLVLKNALDELYSYHDVITSENFCESFIEFRSVDEYTLLLKHTRYMKFLQTPLGQNITRARSMYDEMCSYGFNSSYNGTTMTTTGTINDSNFVLMFDTSTQSGQCEVRYLDDTYKYLYKVDSDGSILGVIKKFISMVQS